jgi:DNA-binding transcriptional LysR family regulator
VKKFRTLDLNRLCVFDAVMTRGSVTRAAKFLAVMRPAAHPSHGHQYDPAGRVVAQSDLLTVLPHSFVAGSVPGRVVVRPLPLEIGPLTVDMVWLARRDNDPSGRWLHEQVQRAVVFG